MKYDFGGWATRNDLTCADGRVIKKDAFKGQNGMTVPLVWMHNHNAPDNVLGFAHLENRDDGVYHIASLTTLKQVRPLKNLLGTVMCVLCLFSQISLNRLEAMLFTV